MTDDNKEMKCRLCRKTKKLHQNFGVGDWSWRGVCNECFRLWELGKKAEKAAKADGTDIFVAVKLALKLDGKHRDAIPETQIRSTDIIAAMGAVKLRGTEMGGPWHGVTPKFHIGDSGSGWDFGGFERVKVAKSRAAAMKRIIDAFMGALARVRLDGFTDGRNLLAGLAKGWVKVSDFDEKADNAAAGRKIDQ